MADQAPTPIASVTQEKACQILKDGTANGQQLTPAQQRFFGAICSGQAPKKAENGTIVMQPALGHALLDAMHDMPNVPS